MPLLEGCERGRGGVSVVVGRFGEGVGDVETNPGERAAISHGSMT
jgi:hypothetical protein